MSCWPPAKKKNRLQLQYTTCTQVSRGWFNSGEMTPMRTTIFEICLTRPFQRAIAQAPKFANCWDTDSQLLETLIKISPDGANFWRKSSSRSEKQECKELASQLFSVSSCSYFNFLRFIQISNGYSSELRRAERLFFCMVTSLTPLRIYAKN